MTFVNPYPNKQPRYSAYCVTHDKTPDEMLAHDRKRWPGGCMCGFLIWMNAASRMFKDQYPEAIFGSGIATSYQDTFTAFLFKCGIDADEYVETM